MRVPLRAYKGLTLLREELNAITKDIAKLSKRQSWLIRCVRHYEDWTQHENKSFVHYGITKDDYDKLRLIQNESCAICGTHDDELPKGLVIDHDHATGIVRGLLCSLCNKGIGLLKDDEARLLQAISYLKSPPFS